MKHSALYHASGHRGGDYTRPSSTSNPQTHLCHSPRPPSIVSCYCHYQRRRETHRPQIGQIRCAKRVVMMDTTLHCCELVEGTMGGLESRTLFRLWHQSTRAL
ncbi:hypothetical protein CPC08DRAFT_175936 [Agrocybe pediades]|nr:hypothetical protein CPC08DRAFT_175936 [Agrocybe pediades]